jgi:SAM-dependent methyltransferase
MYLDDGYRDSPLILAQQEMARAIDLINKTLGEPDPQIDPRPESPISIRRDALQELVPRWHFAMLNDRERNQLFERAIEGGVNPGDHVLDIGSGSGLLAMIAARRGAGRVTSCEFVPPVARAAEQIVAKNGFSELIDVVNMRSDLLDGDTDLSELADVIVTEIVDCGLVGEGILPTLRHAREHLLKPGGSIIPRAARVTAVPVDSWPIWRLNRVDDACGFDVSHFNEFATSRYFQVRLPYWPHRKLAAPLQVLSFDFLNDSLEAGEKTIQMPIQHDGTCHGIAFWFELDLGSEQILSNQPDGKHTHWLQAFQCFTNPVPVKAGSTLTVKIIHNDEIVYFEPRNSNHSAPDNEGRPGKDGCPYEHQPNNRRLHPRCR